MGKGNKERCQKDDAHGNNDEEISQRNRKWPQTNVMGWMIEIDDGVMHMPLQLFTKVFKLLLNGTQLEQMRELISEW